METGYRELARSKGLVLDIGNPIPDAGYWMLDRKKEIDGDWIPGTGKEQGAGT